MAVSGSGNDNDYKNSESNNDNDNDNDSKNIKHCHIICVMHRSKLRDVMGEV